MAEQVLALTRALIQRRSVTPADVGCLELIGERLARAGFGLQRFDCGEVSNLWARRGSAAPVFVFAGHTDVVPSGALDLWQSPPFTPSERDGLLYGRGAADMKSALAAMVIAAERFVSQYSNHSGSLCFLLTSDEEGVARDGTRHVVSELRRRGQPIDWCLVGEPSCSQRLGDVLRNGRRGSLSGHLQVHGVQGHVAYPDKALNPIHAALPVLKTLSERTWDDGDAYFPPTSLQISNIAAGTGVDNVIPATLEATFNFRFSPASPAHDLQTRVESVLQAQGLDYALDWHLSGEPFFTRPGRLVDAAVAAISDTLGVVPTLSTGGGTSDGRFIAPYGADVVEFGPVNESIHQIDEHVRIADLEPLAAAYEAILVKLLR